LSFISAQQYQWFELSNVVYCVDAGQNVVSDSFCLQFVGSKPNPTGTSGTQTNINAKLSTIILHPSYILNIDLHNYFRFFHFDSRSVIVVSIFVR
jgi:hypothetical protein